MEFGQSESQVDSSMAQEIGRIRAAASMTGSAALSRSPKIASESSIQETLQTQQKICAQALHLVGTLEARLESVLRDNGPEKEGRSLDFYGNCHVARGIGQSNSEMSQICYRLETLLRRIDL